MIVSMPADSAASEAGQHARHVEQRIAVDRHVGARQCRCSITLAQAVNTCAPWLWRASLGAPVVPPVWK